jgi:hypothetical protein
MMGSLSFAFLVRDFEPYDGGKNLGRERRMIVRGPPRNQICTSLCSVISVYAGKDNKTYKMYV